LRSADGAFLVGVMGEHTPTRWAKSMSPPARTIRANQRRQRRSHRERWREVEEETGLTAADVEADVRWYPVFAGSRSRI